MDSGHTQTVSPRDFLLNFKAFIAFTSKLNSVKYLRIDISVDMERSIKLNIHFTTKVLTTFWYSLICVS